ncbi:unnamed protein product [Soboliphyme baturini]|uniref:CAP-Gly domain-containing protein n=1 Tax=Soboliphyme baturini TaxID=241478 RepID=A0A183IX10_9BILA|nr:unnamed protein product [Soboliphyme baturini]
MKNFFKENVVSDAIGRHAAVRRVDVGDETLGPGAMSVTTEGWLLVCGEWLIFGVLFIGSGDIGGNDRMKGVINERGRFFWPVAPNRADYTCHVAEAFPVDG